MKPPRTSNLGKIIHALFLVGCSIGGMVFVGKLFSFLRTLKSEEMSDFAADPIIVYGFVAMGFLFLLGWAFLTGQFEDVEAPKHEMLRRFAELEEAEARLHAGGEGQHG